MNYNFRIGDIFEKIDNVKIRAKANDFPEMCSAEYCIPLLTAGAENQGFARYARKEDCPEVLSNVISVSANGANSGICFYQPDDFAVLQDAYAIRLIDRNIQCKEEGLYLTCTLNKAVRDNHDWSNKAGWNHIKDDILNFLSSLLRIHLTYTHLLISTGSICVTESQSLSVTESQSWMHI